MRRTCTELTVHILVSSPPRALTLGISCALLLDGKSDSNPPHRIAHAFQVFVNAQKFAWYAFHPIPPQSPPDHRPSASCIKGHRSSSCFHVDRPLFQVRRKGRPVSQCTECRDARKSNRYHGRCSCETQPSQSTHHFTRGMSRRFGSCFVLKYPFRSE
jgi:hypothetical protein